MRRLVAVWCLVLLTMVSHAPAMGQTPDRRVTQDSAVIALNAQLSEMRASRQDLLNTVLWALGLAGGTAFLLVGYSWFTNSRSYERDKAAMAGELRNELHAEFLKLRGEIDRLNKAQTESLQGIADRAVSTRFVELDQRIHSLGWELASVKRDMLEGEIERAETKKEGWRALSARLQTLRIAQEHGSDYRVADELEGMSRLLHQPWFRLDAEQASEIMSAMDAVDSIHTADADAIRQQVRRLRTPVTAPHSPT